MGDSPWLMIVQLTPEQIVEYLDARAAQNFNAIIVELVESHFSDHSPANASGVEPFLVPGDITTPNPRYFDAAYAAIELARARGFLVLMAPLYIGFKNTDEGWYDELLAAGASGAFEYGKFVGERFADLDNIIWVHGGDDLPPPDGLALVERVRDGIVAGGAPQMHTAHWSREISATDGGVGWLDLNTTYTGKPVYIKSSEDDAINLPHLLIEAQYELDSYDNTPQYVRSQAYEALLTGAIGSMFGNGVIWPFLEGWQTSLDSIGARDMSHIRPLFEPLAWSQLVPDVVTRKVVSDPGAFGDADTAVAASTPDRSDIVVYQPEDAELAVELGCGPGAASARWYDPTAGRFVPAAGSVDGQGRMTVEHPGPNGAGDADWVLVVHIEI